MRTSTSRVKAFLRVFLVFVLASWLLFDRIVANRGATGTGTVTVGASTTTSTSSNKMLKHWKWNEREIYVSVDDHHLNSKRLVYVSKRRVPNGPDPIHNRFFQREVKTRQPPSA